MGPGLGLELRQSQQLAMTPQLQQAIRLLQLSNLELAAHLEAECEKNPLIALDEAPSDDAPAPEPEPDEAPTPDPSAAENLYDTGPGDGPGATPGHLRAADRAVGGGPDAPDAWVEDRLVDRPTLRANLHAQLGQMRTEPMLRLIAGALVEMLDEHGYLREDPAGLARRLGTAPERVEAALRLVQGCEPVGVGARSLSECLALQLAERDRLDPAMRVLLDNLDLLARGDHRRLRRLVGLDDEDFAAMLAELRSLDPRPCAGFDATQAETLVPDIFVSRTAEGGWRVELNDETLPRLLIDRSYAAELARGSGEVRRFLAERRSEATWLVRSLEQRARTILKVASEIVRHQEGFIERGITALRPLTLRAVAEATGLHESTVSRVTANKYVATERGTFELRFFFTNAVGGEGGVAASSIRHRIKALVAAEPADAVLSDDGIVEALAREGIEVARRTVAKYRKALAIPSSVDRRRRKALAVQG